MDARAPATGFADRLAGLVEERRSQIVLGLDPDPAALWPVALEGDPTEAAALAGGAGAAGAAGESMPAADVTTRTAAAVARHCRAAIDAAGPHCVAVKPQLACFERLGAPGWDALTEVVQATHDAGLLLIADGKRGDVPVTAKAYAQALVGETPGPYGPTPGLKADAFTANPLLGRDALEPLLDAAAQAGAGCFVLVRTSNPGAAEIQDEPADQPLHERLATLVDELGQPSTGACGLSSTGAVTGATRPDLLHRLRDLMPRAIFLLPGVGAQGGSASDLGPAFAPHPAAGLIASSRSIVGAHANTGEDPQQAAAKAAEQLKHAAWAAATTG